MNDPLRGESGKLHDQHSRRKILFLLPYAPRLDAAHGGGRVMAQLLLKLATRNRLAVLYLRAAGEPPVDDLIIQQCELVEEVERPEREAAGIPMPLQRLSATFSLLRGSPLWSMDWKVAAYRKRLRLLVESWQPELIQIEYHIMGQYLTALDGYPAPRVLTQHDPGSRTARDLRRSRQSKGRIFPLLDLLAWERYERRIMNAVQAVVVFTEQDRHFLSRLAPRTPMVIIPFGTMLPEKPLNSLGDSELNLLFVGNFSHPPNVDAATRLVTAIFPCVQEQYPDLRLMLVGDQVPQQIQQYASEQVVVTGRVPEVTPYLDRATLVVVPLRQGGGMRVKVLEALAAGKAVVASPLAVEGLDLTGGEQVALAETDQQFCDIIMDLLVDAGKRGALAARARAWACENLGWEKRIADYEALYQRLVGRP